MKSPVNKILIIEKAILIILLLIPLLLVSQVGIGTTSPSGGELLIIEENFEKIEAMNEKSIDKIEDLYEYLNIIGNSDFDYEIRNHTMSLVKKLFEEGSTIPNIMTSSNSSILIDEFLMELIKSKESVQFSTSEVKLEFNNLLHYSLTINKGTNEVISVTVFQTIDWGYDVKKFGNRSKTVLVSTFGSITKVK